MMKLKQDIFCLLLTAFVLFVPLQVIAMNVAVTRGEKHSAMATLSRRAAKPGDPVELLLTIRSNDHPHVSIPTNLAGLRCQILRNGQRLTVDGENIWLFRYRVTAMQIGDYEIPPLRVITGNDSLETKPLLLHISKKGEALPLSSRELALGVNIPDALSDEILKAVPRPTPIPEPSPSPRDVRPLTAKVSSSAWNAVKSFWNYPGK